MSNNDARFSETTIGPMQDGILSADVTIDVEASKLLCFSYGYPDQWSLPIETVAPAFSCHQ